MHFNSFKYKESPQRVCAKHRHAAALARGHILTKVHIGASQLGKCVGLSPYPDAQTNAFEELLKAQNAARWAGAVSRHQQIAEHEQVQQLLLQQGAEVRQSWAQLQQVSAFDTQREAKMAHQAALADFQACLVNAAAQQQADADKTALLQAAAAEDAVKTDSNPADADGAARVAIAAEDNGEAAALLLEAASSIADLPLADACSEATVSSHDAPALAADKQASEQEVFFVIPTSSEAGWLEGELPESDDSARSEPSVSEMSYETSTEPAMEPIPALTPADVQLISKCAQEISRCAYGQQAEHAMIMEFEAQQAQQAQHADSAQQGNFTWCNMGAPESWNLGEYSGICFELGCQVDRAHLHPKTGKAIPVEFKNRTTHFPHSIPLHELVQVQAQLQLLDAPMGYLLERLEVTGREPQLKWHEVLRDDYWWQDELMPALQAFLTILARVATEEKELEMYMSQRADDQHRQYLRRLMKAELRSELQSQHF